MANPYSLRRNPVAVCESVPTCTAAIINLVRPDTLLDRKTSKSCAYWPVKGCSPSKFLSGGGNVKQDQVRHQFLISFCSNLDQKCLGWAKWAAVSLPDSQSGFMITQDR